MKDQNSIYEGESKQDKWNRGLDIFIESVIKPDPALRQCAHNQLCYHELMDVRQDVLERGLDVRGLQRGGLDVAQTFGLRVFLRVRGLHDPQVFQVGLVPDERDHDVCVGVVTQLLEPLRRVFVRFVLRHVVHQQRADGAPVVRAGDGPVPLLPRGVPDLRLDGLALHFQRPRRELHADGALGLERKLVPRETGEKVGLADAAVPDHHHLEQVIVAARRVRGRRTAVAGQSRARRGAAAGRTG